MARKRQTQEHVEMVSVGFVNPLNFEEREVKVGFPGGSDGK